MADTKISALTELTSADTDDVLAIVDTSATETKKIQFSNLFPDASTTIKGKVELAIASETTTGTSATLAVTPDALSGSDYGKREVQINVINYVSDVTTGDGKGYFRIPATLNGYNLVSVYARFITAGSGAGTTDIQIANVTDSVDMLSTKITIDSGEADSATAATPAVIDTTKDDVATADLLRIDVDAVSGNTPKGLIVGLTFQLP